MATDLNQKQVSGQTKLIGADTNGVESNYAVVDSAGRISVSPLPLLTPSRTIARVQPGAGATVYKDYTPSASQNFDISMFYAGATTPLAGVVSLIRHSASTTSLIPFGDFESSGDVAQWTAVTGTFTAPTPDASAVQTIHGATSMRWTYSNSGTAQARQQTFASAIDMSAWRYITGNFFNDATTAVTRTITVILTSNGSTRTYSLAGTAGTTFASNTWIPLQFEIENPTSSTGTTFDLTAVTAMTLQFRDSGNKTGTIYWDYFRLSDSLEILHRIYIANGITVQVDLPFAETIVPTGTFYISVFNSSAAAGEFCGTVVGVLR